MKQRVSISVSAAKGGGHIAAVRSGVRAGTDSAVPAGWEGKSNHHRARRLRRGTGHQGN